MNSRGRFRRPHRFLALRIMLRMTTSTASDIIKGLHVIVGDKGLVTDAEAGKFHNDDWRGAGARLHLLGIADCGIRPLARHAYFRASTLRLIGASPNFNVLVSLNTPNSGTRRISRKPASSIYDPRNSKLSPT